MVKVAVINGRLEMILFILAVSGSSNPLGFSLDPGLFDLKNYARHEDLEVQREKFDRSKNYFSRANNFTSQQPRYHRQFGNGGISGRVPYHLKREKHLYRSQYR